MTVTEEFKQAWNFIEHTSMSIFLTGKAGTGKTTFLKYVKEHSTKRMVVVAPSGVAAINAGGVTIHSFFQLSFAPYVPGTRLNHKFDLSAEKRKIIRMIDLLVIDEISMVRADILDQVDQVLRHFRRPQLPFGGVQLLMIGDLNQLNPVLTYDDERILGQCYASPFFFDANAIKATRYVTIQFQQVFRQNDESFLTILNEIRDGKPSKESLERLNSRVIPDFRPNAAENYIHLTTHNHLADEINEKELRQLKASSQEFIASVKGNFPELSYPTDSVLTLKAGAQVMFIRNAPDSSYYNGKIGVVTHLSDDSVTVKCSSDEQPIIVHPTEWENTRYKLSEDNEVIASTEGTFKQLPLRLAWAITIHKSQGLTFEHAIIDAGHSFAPGQVYVALSRCKTLGGMVLTSPILPQNILINPQVQQYIARQVSDAEKSISQLPFLQEQYYTELLLELFDFTEIINCQDQLLRFCLIHLGVKYQDITQIQSKVSDLLKEKVATVAVQWCTVLKSKSTEQLKSVELARRIKDAAGYFAKSLEQILGSSFESMRSSDFSNKVVQKRIKSNLDLLVEVYRIKLFVLEKVAEVGFSIETFRKAKADALPKQDLHKEKRNKPKEPRVPTQEQTFILFKQGHSVEHISRLRKLNISTVYLHLGQYVAKGKLLLETFIPEERVEHIRKAIHLVGVNNGMAPIRQLLGFDYQYWEIIMVAEADGIKIKREKKEV